MGTVSINQTKYMYGVVNLETVNMMINLRLTEAELVAALQRSCGKARAESMALAYEQEAERYNYVLACATRNECQRHDCLAELHDILLTATDNDTQGVTDYINGRPTRSVALAMRNETKRSRCVNAVYQLLVGRGVIEIKAVNAAVMIGNKLSTCID